MNFSDQTVSELHLLESVYEVTESKEAEQDQISL